MSEYKDRAWIEKSELQAIAYKTIAKYEINKTGVKAISSFLSEIFSNLYKVEEVPENE